MLAPAQTADVVTPVAREVREVREVREAALAERELTALWLLGRVPGVALPWPVIRFGRAGRGPGPDVREATFVRGGVPVCGDVEVHLLASDFERHGHLRDPAYANVVLHVVWCDDRAPAQVGTPQALPLGRSAPTVAIAPLLAERPRRLRALLALGPSGHEPCARQASLEWQHDLVMLVRREGQRRLAERAWRAGALAVERGWAGAWTELLDQALARSAGRHAESAAARVALGDRVSAALGTPVERRLAALAHSRDGLVAALRARGALGASRAAEVGWNAALPLVIALATAYEDITLARLTARLARDWPAPRPYGRSRALESLLGENHRSQGGGALWSQGLLHLQDLWCSRGGCGACPLSAPAS